MRRRTTTPAPEPVTAADLVAAVDAITGGRRGSEQSEGERAAVDELLERHGLDAVDLAQARATVKARSLDPGAPGFGRWRRP